MVHCCPVGRVGSSQVLACPVTANMSSIAGKRHVNGTLKARSCASHHVVSGARARFSRSEEEQEFTSNGLVSPIELQGQYGQPRPSPWLQERSRTTAATSAQTNSPTAITTQARSRPRVA